MCLYVYVWVGVFGVRRSVYLTSVPFEGPVRRGYK